MNGLNNLPNKSDTNTSIFYFAGSGSFQVWNKPPGISVAHIVVIGAGGGGGGGAYSSSAIGSIAGGSGGAPGGYYCGTLPSFLLPDKLYILVGQGGNGGVGVNSPNPSTGSNGNSGGITYVCMYPEVNSGSILLQSSLTEASGGLGGVIGSSTTSNPTAITVVDQNLLRWVPLNTGTTINSTINGAGSATVTGGSPTYAGLLTGGGGGGGHSVNGGNGTAGGGIIVTSPYSYVYQGTNGGAAGSNAGSTPGNGSHGYTTLKNFFTIGGGGGGGYGVASIIPGGNGGNGGIGCGGGGGGAGSSISGTGGNGGHGIVIITYY